MKCFFQFYYSGNFHEARNDATAAVNLEPTLTDAIETGKILDSTDLLHEFYNNCRNYRALVG